jgi:Helix-hairpin-helix motif
MRPNPGPSLRPVWKKVYLWSLALIGGGICVAVLAAALAPSPGNHVQPIGGVLGSAGLLFSIWIAWYAHCVPLGNEPVADAKGRLRARERSLALLKRNPQLAAELAIGRPDLPRRFDDGGLIDMNHAPEAHLASLPGIDDALAAKIVSIRSEVGGFDSAADLETVLNLPPQELDQARPLMIFR